MLLCNVELKLKNAFNKIGIPDGVFQTLVGDSSIAETLIDSEDVNAVTFTGSVPLGAKVATKGNIANKEMCT